MSLIRFFRSLCKTKRADVFFTPPKFISRTEILLCRYVCLAGTSRPSKNNNFPPQPSSRDSNSTDVAEGHEDRILHTPVMAKEIIDFFSPENGQVYLDMTFGAGGHTRRILEAATTTVYTLDRDPISQEISVEMSKIYGCKRLVPLKGKFSQIDRLLNSVGVEKESFDGVLFDLGCSSIQMDSPERGFSLSKNGPLDMRMDGPIDPNLPSAEDVVNNLSEENLASVISKYGEEPHSAKIAKLLVDYRNNVAAFTSTKELATVVACGFSHREAKKTRDKLGRQAHVATRTFQAIRIFVNNELDEISRGLHLAAGYLKPGGKMAALSFHSLEDRIVKRFLKRAKAGGRQRESMEDEIQDGGRQRDSMEDEIQDGSQTGRCWEIVNKAVVKASITEVEKNPRARSAKLRMAIKM